jgi:hypothetical protein
MYAIMCILNLISIFIGYALINMIDEKGDDEDDTDNNA